METYSNIICKRKKPQARNFSLQFNTFLMQHKNTNSLCPMYVRTQCAKVFEAINTLKWHWSHIHTYTHIHPTKIRIVIEITNGFEVFA